MFQYMMPLDYMRMGMALWSRTAQLQLEMMRMGFGAEGWGAKVAMPGMSAMQGFRVTRPGSTGPAPTATVRPFGRPMLRPVASAEVTVLTPATAKPAAAPVAVAAPEAVEAAPAVEAEVAKPATRTRAPKAAAKPATRRRAAPKAKEALAADAPAEAPAETQPEILTEAPVEAPLGFEAAPEAPFEGPVEGAAEVSAEAPAMPETLFDAVPQADEPAPASFDEPAAPVSETRDAE